MTGDGVNDSLALKAADIGIAMGRSGSEAAREVAHVVLKDDDLLALAPAIEHGRTAYTNIQKAIRFILATNLSEILVMLAGSAVGLEQQPLTPAQLLWINLITDVFPALALGLEPPEPNIMAARPRDPHEEIVGSRDAQSLCRQAALMSTGALGAYGYGLWKYGLTNHPQTICFASLVAAQLLHTLGSRSRRRPFNETPPNPFLSAVLGSSFMLQSAAILLAPIRRLLGTAPIGMVDALVALATGAVPFIANEVLKNPGTGTRTRRAARSS
jgi:Ca2+-transporting ATPase